MSEAEYGVPSAVEVDEFEGPVLAGRAVAITEPGDYWLEIGLDGNGRASATLTRHVYE